MDIINKIQILITLHLELITPRLLHSISITVVVKQLHCNNESKPIAQHTAPNSPHPHQLQNQLPLITPHPHHRAKSVAQKASRYYTNSFQTAHHRPRT